MASKDEIMNALKECYDPEIPINVVDLGLIYGVKINSGSVKLRITLTALGCPLSGTIIDDIKNKIRMLKGIKKVDVEIVFDPPWSPDKMSEEARKMLGV
jgi:metal-sulfur cluster biosynthetic enzyme